jgi:hypothetical protein
MEASNLNIHRSFGKVEKYIQAGKLFKYVNDPEGNGNEPTIAAHNSHSQELF